MTKSKKTAGEGLDGQRITKSKKPASAVNSASGEIDGKVDKPEIIEESRNVENDLNLILESKFSKSNKTQQIEYKIDQLPELQKNTASEVLLLFKDQDYEISDKFKFEIIQEKNLQELLIRTQNLSLCLKTFSDKRDPAALRIIKNKSLNSTREFHIFKKLASKHSLLSRFAFPQLAEEIFSSTIFKKSDCIIQIQAAAFFAKNGINPTKIISHLDNVTEHFNNQDENFQIEIFRGLRKWHIESVYHFLSHIDGDRLRIDFCKIIIEELTLDEILCFFNWKNADSKFSKIGIYKRIIYPYLDNFIKWGQDLESLLLLWPYLIQPENGFELVVLKTKFKGLIGKNGILPESLRDGSVPLLQREIQEAKDSLNTLKRELTGTQEKLTLSLKIQEEISSELEELRTFKRENIRDVMIAHESVERQLRIDLLRDLVPIFEKALSSEKAPDIISMLEDLKIEVVGTLNQKVRWNPSICESLTGAELSEGVVVKTGFTWFTGKEVVPLRRMLLKPE